MNKVEIHAAILDEIHKLFAAKNADYGDSFARLRKRYPNFVCMRVFDKLNRLETCMDEDYSAKVSDETVEDTLLDIANYCIMEVMERRFDKETQPKPKPDKRDATMRVWNTLKKVAEQYHLVADLGCAGIICKECPAEVEERCVFGIIHNLAEGKEWNA